MYTLQSQTRRSGLNMSETHEDKISLECCLKEALNKNQFQIVDDALKMKPSDIDCRCSENLLSILDNIVNVDIHRGKYDHIALVMRCLCYFSIPTNENFSFMIEQGLIQKMLEWFEHIKEVNASDLISVESFTTLLEDVFDAIVAVSEYSQKGNSEVLNAFLLPASLVVQNNAFHFSCRIEAIRSLNVVLNQTNSAEKQQLTSTASVQTLIMEWAELLPIAGDYEMQVALVESLCRLNSEKTRYMMAHMWFKSKEIESHFTSIKDSAFETDGRKFINAMNKSLGEKQSVHSLPCECVYFDEYQLRKPNDKRLEEFWIDFNTGSHRISFYTIDESQLTQDPLWDIVSLPEEMVTNYSLDFKIQVQALTICFSKNVTFCNLEGKCIKIIFKNHLNLMDIVYKVYGKSKCENIKTKRKVSEAKMITSGNPLVVSVPESQTDLYSETLTSDPKCTTDHNDWSKSLWSQVQTKTTTTLSVGKAHDSSRKENVYVGLRKTVKSVKPTSMVNQQQGRSSVPIGFSRTSKTASGGLTASPRSKTKMKLPLDFTNSSKKQQLSLPVGDVNPQRSNANKLQEQQRKVVTDTLLIDQSGQSKIHSPNKTNMNNRNSVDNNTITIVKAPVRRLSMNLTKSSKEVIHGGDKSFVTVREESKTNSAKLKRSVGKNSKTIKDNVVEYCQSKSAHTPDVQDINEILQNALAISLEHLGHMKLPTTEVNILPSTSHTTTVDDVMRSNVGRTDTNLSNGKPAHSELKPLRNEKENHKLPATTRCEDEIESSQLQDVNATNDDFRLHKERLFANKNMSKNGTHNIGKQLKRPTSKEPTLPKGKCSTLSDSQCNASIPQSQMSWLSSVSKKSKAKLRFYGKKIVKKMSRNKQAKAKNSKQQPAKQRDIHRGYLASTKQHEIEEKRENVRKCNSRNHISAPKQQKGRDIGQGASHGNVDLCLTQELNQRFGKSHERVISTQTDLSMNISSNCSVHVIAPSTSRSICNSSKINKKSLKDTDSNALPAQSAAKIIRDPHKYLTTEKEPKKSLSKNTVVKDKFENDIEDIFLSLRSFSDNSPETVSSRTFNNPLTVQKNVNVDKGAPVNPDVNKVTSTAKKSYCLKPDDSVEKLRNKYTSDEIEDCASPCMNIEMSPCLIQDYDISPSFQSSSHEDTNEIVSPIPSLHYPHSPCMVKRKNYKKVICYSDESGPCHPPQAARLGRKRKRGADEDVFEYQDYSEQSPKSAEGNVLLPKKLFKLPTGKPSPIYNLECEGTPASLCDEDNECDMNTNMEENIGGVLADFGNAVKNKLMNKCAKIARFTNGYVSIAGKHMKDIWRRMKEQRTRQLNGLQKIIADELQNAKEDIYLLNSLEEKSTTFLKEQLHVTANVRERQYKRLYRIKSALLERYQRCPLDEAAKTMMNSTMEVLKKTMATEQITLLKELQKEDITHAQQEIYKAFYSAHNETTY
ncbi:uncharacterized protein LOC116942600 isoform X2 [Petromyzon marinus]|uniref:uncharacterized protein LOC116942600 isoform X2 n=1 Tax=Petromyzon marinus TaxID=7757 RepID=UPI003F6EB4E8